MRIIDNLKHATIFEASYSNSVIAYRESRINNIKFGVSYQYYGTGKIWNTAFYIKNRLEGEFLFQ